MTEPEPFSASELLAKSKAQSELEEAKPPPCGLRHWSDEAAADGEVVCNGLAHLRVSIVDGRREHWALPGRCDHVVRAEVRARISEQRRRLEAELGGLSSEFDPRRPGLSGGDHALEVMRRFVRRPSFNVLLVGTTGLGKTHLLLRSHFELLSRGVSSQYVGQPELRDMFHWVKSFNGERADEARERIERYVYAAAVHFDDAGGIENDQRGRGGFAEGLMDLLTRRRGKWVVATNRTSSEMERSPDANGAVVSRLVMGCEVVHLDGPDFRIQSARRSPAKQEIRVVDIRRKGRIE